MRVKAVVVRLRTEIVDTKIPGTLVIEKAEQLVNRLVQRGIQPVAVVRWDDYQMADESRMSLALRDFGDKHPEMVFVVYHPDMLIKGFVFRLKRCREALQPSVRMVVVSALGSTGSELKQGEREVLERSGVEFCDDVDAYFKASTEPVSAVQA